MGLKMPAQALVGRILTQVVAADEQRDPVISGKGYSIRRYRDKLYCLTYQPGTAPQLLDGQDIIWPCGQNSIKVSPNQILIFVPAEKGILREQWLTAKVEVRLRRGGEKICLPGRTGHHTLKKLFQEAGIPPWQRDAIPLIYLDDTLAAVGDQWISAQFYSEKPQDCISLLLQSCE
jgi:tRNA(Ile)-lysidine synthase